MYVAGIVSYPSSLIFFFIIIFIVIIIITTTIALCSPTGLQASERASNRMSAVIETASILCPPSRQIAKKVEHIFIYSPVHSSIHSFTHVCTHPFIEPLHLVHAHILSLFESSLPSLCVCGCVLYGYCVIMLSAFSYFMKSWLSSGWWAPVPWERRLCSRPGSSSSSWSVDPQPFTFTEHQ